MVPTSSADSAPDSALTGATRARPGIAEIALRAVAAIGLAIDAYTHFHLAPLYPGLGDGIAKGTLFRIEASLAVLAVLGVLLVRRRIVTLAAFLLASGGVGVLLLFAYVDPGEIGPFKDLYDPGWYPSPEKALSAIAMGVAAVALLILLLRRTPTRR